MELAAETSENNQNCNNRVISYLLASDEIKLHIFESHKGDDRKQLERNTEVKRYTRQKPHFCDYCGNPFTIKILKNKTSKIIIVLQ